MLKDDYQTSIDRYEIYAKKLQVADNIYQDELKKYELGTSQLMNLSEKKMQVIKAEQELLEVILSFLFVGCNTNEEPVVEAINEEIDSPKNNLPLVSTYEVIKKPFLHFHEIQGNTISKSMIYIRPEISGIVSTIHVKEGAFVNKGQQLVSMANSTLIAQLEELKQQLSFSLSYLKNNKNYSMMESEQKFS